MNPHIFSQSTPRHLASTDVTNARKVTRRRRAANCMSHRIETAALLVPPALRAWSTVEVRSDPRNQERRGGTERRDRPRNA